ncbi:hypothetical protein MVEN_02018900 [Mycena venus]|uniref:RRM domain-containing protein n=1 Tax=Mycena venus TaxID=2733690 RepID=A0A8H6XCI2_9AGAR|nr:hypothetical protein MVEN_02018900 [Mycena venus]
MILTPPIFFVSRALLGVTLFAARQKCTSLFSIDFVLIPLSSLDLLRCPVASGSYARTHKRLQIIQTPTPQTLSSLLFTRYVQTSLSWPTTTPGLSADARSEEVSKLFEGYGNIIDCRVMTGFGFDAEDAVTNFNGKPFMGQNIVVEFAKESRPRREPYDGDRNYGAPRSRRPPGIRLIVSGISRDTSWQDLKDFGREAGSVSFADIDRDFRDQGILEYLSREDADRAVKDLDGKDLRGRPVRVALDDSRAGPDNYHRSDRRDDRDRYDRGSYRDDRDRDRYRDDRDRYREERPYRRDRSRSPPRRSDYEDRRPARSPPPRRDDDRRPAGYDDYRRGEDDRRGPDYYDRRRDREDRRRGDDKDYDDRPPRNGDGGWSR